MKKKKPKQEQAPDLPVLRGDCSTIQCGYSKLSGGCETLRGKQADSSNKTSGKESGNESKTPIEIARNAWPLSICSFSGFKNKTYRAQLRECRQ